MKKGQTVMDTTRELIWVLLILLALVFFVYFLKDKITHFFEVMFDALK